MQNPTSLFWSWQQGLRDIIVAGIGAGAAYLIGRKKLPSEIHKTNAEASLAEAQTEQLELKTGMTAKAMLNEMNRYIMKLERDKGYQAEEIRVLRLRDPEFAILEAQVARARANGFIDRDEKGGTGPNPAA
jgi:hypothetical protein